MNYRLEDVPPGSYAIAAYHDLDSDKQFDKNFVGIPKEPVGLSNVREFSKPKWTVSRFDVGAGEVKQDILLIAR